MRLVVAFLTCAAALTVYASIQTKHNLGVEAYPGETEHEDSGVPPDADEQTEWCFAKLRYRNHPMYSPSAGYRQSWGIDSPKAERQFSMGVKRLTRIHTRSIEEVINLSNDEVFNYPWLYAVEVGHWYIDDHEAAKLREYLLRGGFLMTDDFHGVVEWRTFMEGMEKIFPDRPVVDIEEKDPINHVLYDLVNMIQVPGIQYWYTGSISEHGGVIPRWRGIYDDKGRIMVAMCHNQDNGDAWEWSDSPRYPEKYASQAYKMGINYLIYSMTH